MTPEEFFSVLRDAPRPIVQTRRLYHDDQGRVLFYTMEDLAGTYIEVDSETYAQARTDVQIVEGKVVVLPKISEILKLKPSQTGTSCDPRDICIVVDQDQPHVRWNRKP